MSAPSQSVTFERPGSDAAAKPTVKLWPWFLLAILITAMAFYFGRAPRLARQAAVIAENRDLAVLTVAVVHPQPGKAAEALALPAELKPLNEADIFARANGYVKRLTVDIGTRVEEGQLLVELDAPELTRDLEGAKAELVRAEAQYDLAGTTAERWKGLAKSQSVSAQDDTEKQMDVRLQAANVETMKAHVRRIEESMIFTRIVAPFRGIITGRQTDVGDLVSADKNKPLLHIAQVRTLRAFVQVPQVMSRGIRAGQSAELTVPEMPGRVFEARIVRTAGALDAGSRTLLTELHVDNNQDELLAGSFSQVRFPDLKPEAQLTLPANCLLIRPEGTQTAVVGADNRVQLRVLKIGRDFGNSVEVIDGVKAEDQVILNPPDAITDGAEVRVAEAANDDVK
ncbi:MAG TPA: efflux RND transporter periplasmic adaptor subunit [Verrucomicrobiaceae bacterium]